MKNILQFKICHENTVCCLNKAEFALNVKEVCPKQEWIFICYEHMVKLKRNIIFRNNFDFIIDNGSVFEYSVYYKNLNKIKYCSMEEYAKIELLL